MEYLTENLWAFWLIAGAFFLILELLTAGLVSIWFVPPAVITAVISLFLDSFLWQLLIFVILCAVSMVLFRNIYKKYIKKRDDEITPEAHMVGSTAKTIIPTGSDEGKVIVGDVYWRAVSSDGQLIPAGTSVVIKAIQGTTLVVSCKK